MNKKTYFLMIPLIIGLSLVSYKLTYGFFSDSASSQNNTFAAAAVFPPPTINSGDIVINELMWSGSSASTADEWIELRNMTSNPIDLTGWDITNALTSDATLTLTSGVIPANGFFLISNFSETDGNSIINISPDLVTTSLSLDNTNAQYVLRDSTDQVIDTADDGVGDPLAGENNSGDFPDKAMERNSTPGDGTVGTSWHTATTQANLDPEASDSATPKSANSAP